MVQIEPMGKSWRLSCEQWFPASRETVFAFFADPGNLEEITPPWLHFRIVEGADAELAEGSLLRYRLQLHRIPINWTTRISLWRPPFAFEDTQLRGPYRNWLHRHDFESVDGGTLVKDRVDYQSPGGGLVHRFLVRNDLRRIFEYRAHVLAGIFGDGSGRVRGEPTGIVKS